MYKLITIFAYASTLLLGSSISVESGGAPDVDQVEPGRAFSEEIYGKDGLVPLFLRYSDREYLSDSDRRSLIARIDYFERLTSEMQEARQHDQADSLRTQIQSTLCPREKDDKDMYLFDLQLKEKREWDRIQMQHDYSPVSLYCLCVGEAWIESKVCSEKSPCIGPTRDCLAEFRERIVLHSG